MGQIILPGKKWNDILQRLNKEKINDIAYNSDYIDCYASINDNIEAYIHQEGNKFLFFPYIKSPIPDRVNLYDLQNSYGYGGPISNTLDSKFLKKAWLQFSELSVKSGIIAGLIRFHPLLKNHNYIICDNIKLKKDREIVYLCLDKKIDKVWGDFSKDNKEKIKKAKKLNVSVKCDSKLSSVKEFSDFYIKRMEELKAPKFYLFSENYFKKIYKLGKDSFCVYRAFVNDKMIGGALILLSDMFVYYHLSASSSEYFKYAPNNMLRYFVIKDLLGKRRNYLIFGGGRSSNPNDTLLAFKKRFSKEIAWYYYATFIFNQYEYDQICYNWGKENPDKIEKYNSYILKYRY